MPTILVDTSAHVPSVERAFARTVSQWLRRAGVELNHVITRFVPADPGRVFSGPFLLAGSLGEPEPFAFVRCTVGHDRDSDFRRGLAREITRALAPAVRPDRIFIQFQPVDPELHFIGAEIERPSEHVE